MSIFSRQSDPPPPVAPVGATKPAPRPNSETRERSGESTHIASGSKVVGKILGTAELYIDGEIEGEIQLDGRVIVGTKGVVRGEVEARSIQVGGKLYGNVHGIERVEVLNSGSLEGDVTSPRVIIAEGAFFKGKVEMTDKNERPGAGKNAGRAPAENKPVENKQAADKPGTRAEK